MKNRPVTRRPAAEAAATGPSALWAFGDESVRATPDGFLYLLAAAILPEDECEQMREALRLLLLRGQHRLHWRDETDPRRLQIAHSVAEAAIDSVVVIGARADPRKQRARRQVLGRLLWELDQRQVSRLLLESRRPERDRYDLAAIGGFRNAGVLSRRLVVEFGQPVQEPLLWLPDTVCGAVGDERCGRSGYFAVLKTHVTVVDMGVA